MSTPSTATALPPPIDIANPHYYASNAYGSHHGLLNASHHPRLPPPAITYQPASPLYQTTTVPSSTNKRTASSMASRVQPAPPAPPVARQKNRGRRDRTPVDWDKFYGKCMPKEIIVIDDTPSPPPTAASSVNGHARQPPVVPSSSRAQYPAVNGVAAGGRHTDKKRRTDANQYEPVYTNNHYSSTQTPGGYGSPTTVSAHSAASSVNGISTTAETSLGAPARNVRDYNVNNSATLASNGKRKRIVTRSGAAAAAGTVDAFANYHPPPRPPIKAQEVQVRVIPDPDRHSQHRVDDNDGHYIVTAETDLTPRYRIDKLLGQGTFGKVVEAYDRNKGTKCAIKIIRSVQKYRDASRIELRVLSTLKCNDKDNRNKCIHLRDCFDYKNHICIVTDLLGMSVFDFLKGNQFAPFPNSHIQSFARQLLTSVAFLHDLNLIHTDLKPENILLVNNEHTTYNYQKTIPSSSTQTSRTGRTRRILHDTDIRLIDFGSATFDDEYHSSVVSTRHYRAPEIILGLGWSFPCDIWSIGCILVEFYTGDALFQTHDNLEHLAMMQAVCGPKIDTRLVRTVAGRSSSGASASNASKYFRGAKLDYPNSETSRPSKKYVTAMKNLGDIIPARTVFDKQFLDLLRRIFVYDPNKRITAKEALKHPWFKETIRDEGTEQCRARLEREAERNRSYGY